MPQSSFLAMLEMLFYTEIFMDIAGERTYSFMETQIIRYKKRLSYFPLLCRRYEMNFNINHANLKYRDIKNLLQG